MKSDIKINQSAEVLPISVVAGSINLFDDQIDLYGRNKAKINIDQLTNRTKRDSKLILVTAITPTPSGEGKTTTTIGLADGLRKLDYNAIVCLSLIHI